MSVDEAERSDCCSGGGGGTVLSEYAGGGGGGFISHTLKHFPFGSNEKPNNLISSLVSLTSQPIIIEW